MPSTSITNTGYVTRLVFVVRSIFQPFSHTEVWCFSLQVRHVFVLRHSEALCLEPVQLEPNLFCDNTNLQSDILAIVLYSLDLCPSLSQETQTRDLCSFSMVWYILYCFRFLSEGTNIFGLRSVHFRRASAN